MRPRAGCQQGEHDTTRRAFGAYPVQVPVRAARLRCGSGFGGNSGGGRCRRQRRRARDGNGGGAALPHLTRSGFRNRSATWAPRQGAGGGAAPQHRAHRQRRRSATGVGAQARASPMAEVLRGIIGLTEPFIGHNGIGDAVCPGRHHSGLRRQTRPGTPRTSTVPRPARQQLARGDGVCGRARGRRAALNLRLRRGARD